MYTQFIRYGVITLAFGALVLLPGGQVAQAVTSSEEVAAQIKALTAQIQTLQKQLETLRGEAKAIIRTSITEGTTGADITKLQQLLATDPTIYPEGKVTGYFGPLTKEAIRRFQSRHSLPITGEVSSTTRELLEEYLHEGFGDQIPAGLLKAPGIVKKVELRYCASTGNAGMGPLCKKYEVEDDDDDIDNEDDADDENDDDATHEVEIEIEDDMTTVSFHLDGAAYTVEVRSLDIDDVLAAVARRFSVNVENLNTALVAEITNAFSEELDDAKSTVSSTGAKKAAEAIANAEEEIDEAQSVIDEVDDDIQTVATRLLGNALMKLNAAEESYDARRYNIAEMYAEQAERYAKEAKYYASR